MRRDFLRTLFSRMLATYLTVTLGLILIVGVTVVALFQGQLRAQTNEQLIRELQQISEMISANVQSTEQQPGDIDTMLGWIARQSGTLIETYAPDGTRQAYYSEQKWSQAAAAALSEEARAA